MFCGASKSCKTSCISTSAGMMNGGCLIEAKWGLRLYTLLLLFFMIVFHEIRSLFNDRWRSMGMPLVEESGCFKNATSAFFSCSKRTNPLLLIVRKKLHFFLDDCIAGILNSRWLPKHEPPINLPLWKSHCRTHNQELYIFFIRNRKNSPEGEKL